MTSWTAIRDVTDALAQRLREQLQVLSGIDVTTRAPDAMGNDAKLQLNLYLYRVAPNAGFRNAEITWMPSSVTRPPVAVDLHYLLTAYGASRDDLEAQHAFGAALSVLHDEILIADRGQQGEPIRTTIEPLDVDALTKLWSACQTGMRLSSALQVGPVLIESRKEPTATAPVLEVSTAGSPSLDPLFPRVDEARFLTDGTGRPTTVELTGANLETARRATFTHANALLRVGGEIALDAGAVSSTHRTVDVSANTATDWPAGPWMVSVVYPRDGGEETSAAAVMEIVPAITAWSPDPTPAVGDATITIAPPLRVGQVCSLLVGTGRHPIDVAADATTRVTVPLALTPPGMRLVRLDVDGAQSAVLDRRGPRPTVVPTARRDFT